MVQKQFQSIEEAFSTQWISEIATVLIHDLQRNCNLREAFPVQRDTSSWRLPAWCFDVPQSSIGQDDLEAWKFICEHPALLGGVITTWAKQSSAIRACAPASLDHLGLLAEDVRSCLLQAVIQSQALRVFVLDVTTSVIQFLHPQLHGATLDECAQAVRQAEVDCIASFVLELECCFKVELPGLVGGCAPVSRIPLDFIRAPVSISDFPTHSQGIDGIGEPSRAIVSRPRSSGAGCFAVELIDEAWQLRPDHTAKQAMQSRLRRSARARSEAPPAESVDGEPVCRSMRLSDLSLGILVSGAPAFARSALEFAEASIRGALESLDFALLARPSDRKLVFESIVSARPAANQRHASIKSAGRQRPALLRSPGINVGDVDAAVFDHLHHQRRVGIMEEHWTQHVQSAAIGIDESALKAMLEVCVLYPERSRNDERFLNPIAKAFREIHIAARLRELHPGESLVVAITAIESSLLRKDSKSENKTARLASRIVRLLEVEPDGVAQQHLTRWFKILYNIRSRIVHGDVVEEAEIRRQQCAATFLASACLLRLCTHLRFSSRLGLLPTNDSCLDALVEFLARLDDQTSADSRVEHQSIGRWPVQLFECTH